MARSQESYNKKEVRNKKEKKRKEKEKKRLARKENKSTLDDMIAYVDAHGNITDTPPDPDQIEEINPEDIQVSVPRGPLEEIDPVRTGTVAFFNTSKGFGFITDQETRESIFVHVNNLREEIHEGNLVRFEIEKGPRGPVAINVEIVR